MSERISLANERLVNMAECVVDQPIVGLAPACLSAQSKGRSHPTCHAGHRINYFERFACSKLVSSGNSKATTTGIVAGIVVEEGDAACMCG